MGLAEDYEDFLDNLEERGFPSPRIVVPALAILAVAAIVFFILPVLQGSAAQSTKSLDFQVQDASGAPIGGARILLSDAEKREVARGTTDSSGNLQLKNVPLAALTARVEADNHKPAEVSVEAESSYTPVSLQAVSSPPKIERVQVLVVDEESNPVPGAGVKLGFLGEERNSVSDATGLAEFSLSGMPASAGLVVQKNGFEDASRYGVTAGELSNSLLSPIRIVLRRPTPSPAAKASVRVTVLSPTGGETNGIIVSLIDELGRVVKSGTVTASQILFDQVDRGALLGVRAVDPEGEFEPFNSAESFTVDSSFKDVQVQLKRRATGTPRSSGIQVTVRDKENERIPDAVVHLLTRATNRLADSRFTDEDGRASFDASSAETYYLTAYKEGFLPAFRATVREGETVELLMEREALGNFVDATIIATEDGAPADGAGISLFIRGGPRSGFFLGIPLLTTGADGIAAARLPRKIDGADYRVSAVAMKGEKKGESSPATVTGASITLNVSLRLPPAFIDVTVTDKLSNRTLGAALVQAIFNGSIATSCTTDSKGNCALALEAGKEYALIAGASGYIDLRVTPRPLAPRERLKLKAELFAERDLKDVRAELVGVFDAFGNRVLEVGNAQSYRARFRLSAPVGNELEGIYVRVGGGGTVEQADAMISEIRAPGAQLVRYGSATAASGCDPASNASSQEIEAKWAEVAYSAQGGNAESKEIELEISVKEEAKANTRIPIEFRAYAFKKPAPMLFPYDSALGPELLNRANAGAKIGSDDFCGAPVAKREVRVGRRTLFCSDGVCSRLEFFDPTSGLSGGNGFPVPLGRELELRFTVIAEQGIDFVGITSSHFNVIAFESNTTTTLSGAPLSGASLADGAAEQVLAISAQPGERVDGSVRLKAVKPAVRAPIDFNLHLATGSAETRKLPVFARVTGQNKFTVRISATELVLGSEESVRVTVTDSLSRPVESATLTFFECAGTALSGNEIVIAGDGSRNKGRNGIYAEKLRPTGLGSIGIRLENPDFEPFESCPINVIAGDFLSVEPESLEFAGSSAPQQSQAVRVSSSVAFQTRVTSALRCFVGGVPVQSTLLSAEPREFTLAQDEKEVIVRLSEGATASTTCVLVFTASAGTVHASTAVDIAVNATAPPMPPDPRRAYPPVPSSIGIGVDDSGFAQAFYFIGDLGEVKGCRLIAAGSAPLPEEAAQLHCGGGVLALTLQYDFSTQCIPLQGHTSRILVSRNVQGLPAPDAAIGLQVTPASGARVCIVATPIPSPTPSPTETPTPAPGSTPTPSPTPVPVCGDRVCQLTETCFSCEADCANCNTQHCGDGSCTLGRGETCNTCASDCGQCTPSPSPTPSAQYPALPEVIEMRLDRVAFAEKYYDLSSVSGRITGCELRTLDSTGGTAVTNFVRADSDLCARGAVHLVADYAGFPVPPGLYKNLVQTAQLRVLREGNTAEVRTVRVLAVDMPGLPDNPARCGDGTCDFNRGEDGKTCAADCPAVASCTDSIKNGGEEGIDCGPNCPQNCTFSRYAPLPASISLKLNGEGFARATYNMKNLAEVDGCEPVSCEVRSSFLDSRNPLTAINNFVSADAALCTQGIAQITADYATFTNLYRTYVGSGSLYVLCADGSVHTRPVRVSAEDMEGLPENPASCTDGIKNQDEEKIDCGGACAACRVPPSCTDAIKNGNETGVDCGGSCPSLCVENLYDPLPNEIRLVLNPERFAESYFHTKLLSPYPVQCSPIKPSGFVENEEPDTIVTNFLQVECTGSVVHVMADYSSFPTDLLWKGLTQGATFQVAFDPVAGSGSSVGTGLPTGPVLRKTIRVIISAAGITGIPEHPPISGLDTLPSSIFLPVISMQGTGGGPYGGYGFGATTPNQKSFKVKFRQDPQCQFDGFLGAGAGMGQGPQAFGGGVPGMPYGAPSYAFNPISYWPQNPLGDSPEILYPPNYPVECRVPQVLFAPHLCGLCQEYLPGFNFFSPGTFSPDAPARQQGFGANAPASAGFAPGAFPAVAGTHPSFNPFAMGGGLPGYAGQSPYGGYGGFGGGSPFGGYGGAGFGGQYGLGGFGQYGSQFGSPYGGSPFGQFGQGYSLASPLSINPISIGFPSGLPYECMAPSVCTMPQACQLSYCSALMIGGRAALQAQSLAAGAGAATSLYPSVDACSKEEIAISANYQGIAPQSGFTQTNRLRVTETMPNGKTRSKSIPVYIYVYSSFDPLGGGFVPQATQPLWCRHPALGMPAGTVVRISQVNKEKHGLPETIEIKLNPVTLRGEYFNTVPVRTPEGSVIPFLCDSTQLERSLHGSPRVELDCNENGRLHLALDYSQSELASKWRSEADYPQSIKDEGVMRASLSGAGGPTLEFPVKVKVTFDEFRPLEAVLVVNKNTRRDVGGTGYESTQLLSTHQLALEFPTGTLRQNAVAAVQQRLRFDVKVDPADVGKQGKLFIKSIPPREVNLYAIEVPSKIIIKLRKDASGAIVVDSCGNAKKEQCEGDHCDSDTGGHDEEGVCGYPFYPDEETTLPVACDWAGATSTLARDKDGTREQFIEEEGSACNGGRGIYIRPNGDALATYIKYRGDDFDYFEDSIKVNLVLGDGLVGQRRHTIEAKLVGPKHGEKKPPVEARQLRMKAPLSGPDFGEGADGEQEIILSENTEYRPQNARASPTWGVGRPFYVGMQFPQGDSPDKRRVSLYLTSGSGERIKMYSTSCTPDEVKNGCKQLTADNSAASSDYYAFYLLRMKAKGDYSIEASTQVTVKGEAKRITARMPIRAVLSSKYSEIDGLGMRVKIGDDSVQAEWDSTATPWKDINAKPGQPVNIQMHYQGDAAPQLVVTDSNGKPVKTITGKNDKEPRTLAAVWEIPPATTRVGQYLIKATDKTSNDGVFYAVVKIIVELPPKPAQTTSTGTQPRVGTSGSGSTGGTAAAAPAQHKHVPVTPKKKPADANPYYEIDRSD